jgi:hypothetical protein
MEFLDIDYQSPLLNHQIDTELEYLRLYAQYNEREPGHFMSEGKTVQQYDAVVFLNVVRHLKGWEQLLPSFIGTGEVRGDFDKACQAVTDGNFKHEFAKIANSTSEIIGWYTGRAFLQSVRRLLIFVKRKS